MRRVAGKHGLQLTGSSTSTADAYVKMRKAGAAARVVLMQAAAERWGTQATELRTEAVTPTPAAAGGWLSGAGGNGCRDRAAGRSAAEAPRTVAAWPRAAACGHGLGHRCRSRHDHITSLFER